ERKTMAEVETGPEPDLADDHEAPRATLEIERHDRHRVHATPVQNLESIGSRGAATTMEVLRPETLEPQETRPRRVETLENPDPGHPFPRPDHDDRSGRRTAPLRVSQGPLHRFLLRPARRRRTGRSSGFGL